MICSVRSLAITGIQGSGVVAECYISNGLPGVDIVGLPDAAVKEAKNRVQSACENSGFKFPALDIMINLAPADVKKEGSAFDLAIIVAILQSDGTVSHTLDLSDKCFLGELSLSGELRGIGGILPLTISA